jgi:hypothetical protein
MTLLVEPHGWRRRRANSSKKRKAPFTEDKDAGRQN